MRTKYKEESEGSLYPIQYFILVLTPAVHFLIQKKGCCIRLYNKVILFWKIRKSMRDNKKL